MRSVVRPPRTPRGPGRHREPGRVVAGPLLDSKSRIPGGRPGAVPRPRLTGHLAAAPRSALTVLSASAGFGKTTLLTEWLATLPAKGPGVAWLSLDARDDDPARFWTYVVAALRTVHPDVGGAALALLGSAAAGRGVPHRAAQRPQRPAGRPAAGARRLPPRRGPRGPRRDGVPARPPAAAAAPGPRHPRRPAAAPGSPARPRRAGGGPAADLRFTAEEAAAYLNGSMGLSLAEGDVDGARRPHRGLDRRPAAGGAVDARPRRRQRVHRGLRRRRPLRRRLPRRGGARPPAGRGPRRSCCRRPCSTGSPGPLCDAVTGRRGGTRHARRPGARQPVPRRRSTTGGSGTATTTCSPTSCGRTSLEEQRAPRSPSCTAGPAPGSTTTAPGAGRRARPRRAGPRPRRGADGARLPRAARGPGRSPCSATGCAAARRGRPASGRCSACTLVGALAQVSDFDTIPARLDAIDDLLRPGRSTASAPLAGPAAARPRRRRRRRVPGAARAGRDVPRRAGARRAATSTARSRTPGEARALAQPDDDLTRAAAGALAGLASWTRGPRAAPTPPTREAVAGLQRAGHVADVLGCCITLGDIRRPRAGCDGALAATSRPSTWPPPSRAPPLRGTADMHVGIAGVLLERDDLAGAAEHLATSHASASTTGCRRTPTGGGSRRPGCATGRGRPRRALALLDEADRVYDGDYSPTVRPVPAVRARLRLRRGELAHAAAWAAERQLVRRRRAVLPAGVRAPDAGAAAARPAPRRARRRRARPGDPTCSPGCWRRPSRAAGGQRHRGRSCCRPRAHAAGATRPRPLGALDRAVTLAEPRGLRARLRRRGTAAGGAAQALRSGRAGGAYVRRPARRRDRHAARSPPRRHSSSR